MSLAQVHVPAQVHVLAQIAVSAPDGCSPRWMQLTEGPQHLQCTNLPGNPQRIHEEPQILCFSVAECRHVLLSIHSVFQRAGMLGFDEIQVISISFFMGHTFDILF